MHQQVFELLLDDADAHLDFGAAGIVDRLITGFPGTVVVSHRPRRLPRVSAVWELAGGRSSVKPTGPEHDGFLISRSFPAPEAGRRWTS